MNIEVLLFGLCRGWRHCPRSIDRNSTSCGSVVTSDGRIGHLLVFSTLDAIYKMHYAHHFTSAPRVANTVRLRRLSSLAQHTASHASAVRPSHKRNHALHVERIFSIYLTPRLVEPVRSGCDTTHSPRVVRNVRRPLAIIAPGSIVCPHTKAEE